MRIWDIDPGYLARQQLLGEHRELHGLYNILTLGKKGYASHPETLRWVGCVDALCSRHQSLLCEMTLRGYNHHSQLPEVPAECLRPERFIDPPGTQFRLLAAKYADDDRSGRIPLPKNCQQLWAQHKYSVMAHDPNLYRELGSQVAHGCYRDDFDGLALLLIQAISRPPQPGHLLNALQHMWGYFSGRGKPPEQPAEFLTSIQDLAIEQKKTYLLHSTALCELALWV